MADVALAAEAFGVLNGDHYILNDTGEVEVEEHTSRVPIATNTPGSGDAATFCADMDDITSLPVDPIVFTALQTRAFLADQYVYLRNVCQIPAERITDEALAEICILRWLAYKARLICGNFAVIDHHVHYNDATISDAAAPNTRLATIRGDGQYAAGRNRIATWCNANRAIMRKLTTLRIWCAQ